MNNYAQQASILESFGRRVRTLRIERNLTQLELAYKGDFDKNYIGMIERGERNPSLVNIERIAKALNVTLSELFSYNNE